MHFGQNILKEIRKNNIPRYKTKKQNSIEKAKKKKNIKKNKNLYV